MGSTRLIHGLHKAIGALGRTLPFAETLEIDERRRLAADGCGSARDDPGAPPGAGRAGRIGEGHGGEAVAPAGRLR
jgi:hypothetical protein